MRGVVWTETATPAYPDDAMIVVVFLIILCWVLFS